VGEVVRSSGAQLVVIASHGRSGVEKLLVGSFAASVVKQAHVPVLIVRIDREEA